MQNGECILIKLCGINCMSTSSGLDWGQFFYAYLSDDKRNDVFDSCMASCGSENSHADTLRLQYGIISVSRVNLTDNRCDFQAALLCYVQSTNSRQFPTADF